MSPAKLQMFQLGAAKRRSSSSRESGATPLLAASPPTLISIRTASFSSKLLRGGIELLCQAQRIDRIHCGEQFNRFGRLVGLQMADQVPCGVVQIPK